MLYAGYQTNPGDKTEAGYSNGIGQNAAFNTPLDLCYSTYDTFTYVAGILYIFTIIDSKNHVIRRVDLSSQVTTFAGTGQQGSKNGARLSSRFKNPSGITVDKSGTIYIADTGNSIIRKISNLGTVSTLAGNGSQSYRDGIGTNAGFNQPRGLVVDSTGLLLYVADTGNNMIRLINMTSGVAQVSTVAAQPVIMDILVLNM